MSIRTNWAPYILEAVKAVMNSQTIEDAVNAHAHGRDLSAGFEFLQPGDCFQQFALTAAGLIAAWFWAGKTQSSSVKGS